MHENLANPNALEAPAASQEPARSPTSPEVARPNSVGKMLAWLARTIPTLLVLAALGGLAYWGHHSGWTIPRFSTLAGNGQPEKDDWCSTHGVPETQCVECKLDLLPKVKAFGWCKSHGVNECPLEHPEIAQLPATPKITPADLARAQRALEFAERPENNSKCKLHQRRIQFESKEALDKAGIEVAPVWEAPMEEAVAANGEVNYDQTRVARVGKLLLKKFCNRHWVVCRCGMLPS